MKRLNKAISSIGLAMFVAVLLAGAANTASAGLFAEKAFHRDGSIKTATAAVLSLSAIPPFASVAEAIYVDTVSKLGTGINDEVLAVTGQDPLYEALFDIFVYDVDNSAPGSDPNGTVVIEWVRGLAVDASGDF